MKMSTVNTEICSILNFFRKGSGASLCMSFQKIPLRDNSIPCDNSIPSLQYVYCDCFPIYNTMNFENDLSFLITPFPHMTKKTKQKFKYLKNKESF